MLKRFKVGMLGLIFSCAKIAAAGDNFFIVQHKAKDLLGPKFTVEGGRNSICNEFLEWYPGPKIKELLCSPIARTNGYGNHEYAKNFCAKRLARLPTFQEISHIYRGQDKDEGRAIYKKMGLNPQRTYWTSDPCFEIIPASLMEKSTRYVAPFEQGARASFRLKTNRENPSLYYQAKNLMQTEPVQARAASLHHFVCVRDIRFEG